jgi:hypothetical protein
MDRGSSTESHIASIMNGGYRVRHYSRGIRLEIQRQQRAKAIQDLGVIILDALQQSPPHDYEVILTAVVDCLSPRQPDF